MTPNDDTLPPDYTPEQKARIFAEMKAKFTADDLYGYVEDTGEKIPMEQVMAAAEALLRELETREQGARA